MSWQDPLAYMGEIPGQPSVLPTTTPSQQQPWQGPAQYTRGLRLGGFTPLSGLRSIAAHVPTAPTAPASFPEAINFQAPFSTHPPGYQAPNVPAARDQGNIIGSLTDALGDLTKDGLNLGTLVPYIIERPFALLDEWSKQPGLGQTIATTVDTQLPMQAIKAVSDIAAPVITSLDNWILGSQLGDRSKVYAALVQGQSLTGPGSLTMTGEVGDLLGGAEGANKLYGDLTAAIKQAGGKLRASDPGALGALAFANQEAPGSLGPFTSLLESQGYLTDADVQRILADAIDLPDDVKAGIRKDPGAVIKDGLGWDPGNINNANPSQTYLAKLFDQTPDGRQYAYNDPGPLGWKNFVPHIMAQGAVALPLGAGLGAGLDAAAGAEATSTAGIAAVKAAQVARSTLSAAKTITTLGYQLGLGTTLFTGVADAVARMFGDQSALDFIDSSLRNHPISDDPSVQLVTSFSVNPVVGAKLAKAGVLRLAGKAGDVTIGRVLGAKYLKFFTSDDLVVQRLAQMYGTNEAWVRDHIGPGNTYQNMGEAAEEVVNTAADHIVDPRNGLIPPEESASFAATLDGIARTKAVMQAHADEIMNIIEKQPQALVTRFRSDWDYRQMPGQWNPEIAADISRDFRLAKTLTYRLRDRLAHMGIGGTPVVGYREAIPPGAVERIRGDVTAAHPEADSAVPLVEVQRLVKDYPALRTTWPDLIPAGAKSVPRSTVDQMLDRAGIAYNDLLRDNPVRATTGANPVLDDKAASFPDDFAQALGTSPLVAKGLLAGGPDEATTAALRQFLVDKVGIDQRLAQSLTPDEVWDKATDWAYTRAGPWLAAGDRLRDAKATAGVVADRMAQAHAAGNDQEFDRLSGQYKHLQALIADATAPLETTVPFSRRLAGAHVEPAEAGVEVALIEMARRKMRAIETLADLSEIEDQAMQLGGVEGDPLRLIGKRDGGYVWTGGMPVLTAAIRQRIVDHFYSVGKSAKEWDDQRMWEWLRNGAHHTVPGLFTRAQRRFIDNGLATRHSVPLEEAATQSARGTNSGERYADPDAFLDQVMRLADQRDTILAGRQRHILERQADIKVPSQAIEAASANGLLYHDPQFETLVHPANLAKVDEITMDPTAYEALGPRQMQVAPPLPPRVSPAKARALRERLTRQGLADSGERTPEGGRIYTGLARGRPVKLVVNQAAILPPAGTRVTVQTLRDRFGYEDAELDALRAEHPERFASGPRGGYYLEPAPPPATVVLPRGPQPDHGLLAQVVDSDPILQARAGQASVDMGVPYEELLDDPQYAKALRRYLLPDGSVVAPPSPGPLDEAIRTGNGDQLSQEIARLNGQLGLEPPIPQVPLEYAASVARNRRPLRPSAIARQRLGNVGADLNAPPDPALLAAPENRLGIRVISIINHGRADMQPVTLKDFIEAQKEIENGNASRMGIGADLLSAAQDLNEKALERGVQQAKQGLIGVGSMTTGLNPAMIADDDMALAKTLMDAGMISLDPDNPLGLTYGLKRAPENRIPLELQQVPGLAEELIAGHFQPFEERLGLGHVRGAYNYIFGGLGNSEIIAKTRRNFAERLAAQGLDPIIADKVWDAWKQKAKDSRERQLATTKTGARVHLLGENPLYGSIHNIPTLELDAAAHAAVDEHFAGIKGPAGGRTPDLYRTIDYGNTFRDASSGVRAFLADHSGTLGEALAGLIGRKDLGDVYGIVMHNKWVTTQYYWLRFKLDLRYGAMNYMESHILYAGRAALIPGSLDDGLLGMTRDYVQNLGADGLQDASYPFTRSRAGRAYQTFLKLQPGTLETKLKGLASEDPSLLERAFEEMAVEDPELAAGIARAGGTPKAWLAELDTYYGRLLDSRDPEGVIDDAFGQATARDPALAEVYAKLAAQNRQLLADTRETFFGNPNRSRFERTANSFLLYWPISYQIKASRWLWSGLLQHAGGLPTNAAGAYYLNQAIAVHNHLLATDPSYVQWFQQNSDLVFYAQMLFPVTWDAGVSLSPIARDQFFNRTKNIFDIGPVYTFTTVVPTALGDLYRQLSDVPGLGDVLKVGVRAFGQDPDDVLHNRPQITYLGG